MTEHAQARLACLHIAFRALTADHQFRHPQLRRGDPLICRLGISGKCLFGVARHEFATTVEITETKQRAPIAVGRRTFVESKHAGAIGRFVDNLTRASRLRYRDNRIRPGIAQHTFILAEQTIHGRGIDLACNVEVSQLRQCPAKVGLEDNLLPSFRPIVLG
ncbi:hypothetical protein D9M68_397470 [compost metagenome]